MDTSNCFEEDVRTIPSIPSIDRLLGRSVVALVESMLRWRIGGDADAVFECDEFRDFRRQRSGSRDLREAPRELSSRDLSSGELIQAPWDLAEEANVVA